MAAVRAQVPRPRVIQVQPAGGPHKAIEDGLWDFFQGRQFHFRRTLLGSTDPGFRDKSKEKYVNMSGLAADPRRNRSARILRGIPEDFGVKLLRRAFVAFSNQVSDQAVESQFKSVDLKAALGHSTKNPYSPHDAASHSGLEVAKWVSKVLPTQAGPEVTEVLVKLGLDSIGAGVLISTIQLILEAKKRSSIKSGLQDVRSVVEEFKDSLLTTFTGDGVTKVLELALTRNTQKLKFYGVCLVSGLIAQADPTGISQVVTGSMKTFVSLLWKIWELRRTAQMMEKLNLILGSGPNKPLEFNLQLFSEYPLLACYATDAIDTTYFSMTDFMGMTSPSGRIPDTNEGDAQEYAESIHAGFSMPKFDAKMARLRVLQEAARTAMQSSFCVLRTKDNKEPEHCKIFIRKNLSRIIRAWRDYSARKAFRKKVSAAQHDAPPPPHAYMSISSSALMQGDRNIPLAWESESEEDEDNNS